MLDITGFDRRGALNKSKKVFYSKGKTLIFAKSEKCVTEIIII